MLRFVGITTGQQIQNQPKPEVKSLWDQFNNIAPIQLSKHTMNLKYWRRELESGKRLRRTHWPVFQRETDNPEYWKTLPWCMFHSNGFTGDGLFVGFGGCIGAIQDEDDFVMVDGKKYSTGGVGYKLTQEDKEAYDWEVIPDRS